MSVVLRLPKVVLPLLSDAVEQFVADSRLRNLSPPTITFYRVTLGPFARYAASVGCEEVGAVTEEVFRAFLADQRARVSPARLNHFRAAVRRFYEWAITEGYAEVHPAARVPKVREPRRVTPTFTQGEAEALLRAPDTRTFLGLRDQVFMLLLFDTGLRLSEAAGLRLVDLEFDTLTLQVLGKGGRERLVAFSPVLAAHLQRYVAQRASALQSIGRQACPWLFVNHWGLRCGARTLHDRMRRYGEASPASSGCSPGSPRRWGTARSSPRARSLRAPPAGRAGRGAAPPGGSATAPRVVVCHPCRPR
jgi:integrase/recombinase XerD